MIETLPPAIQAFLKESPIPLFIDGQFTPAQDGKIIEVLDPSTGKPAATVSLGSATDIERAVEAAHTALRGWAATPPVERSILLHRLADRIETEAGAIAQLESLDVGKAISAAESFDIPFGIEGLRYYADLSLHAQYETPLALKNIDARVLRVPCGVCGFIFPWNYPFDLLIWGIAPALAAGNTVVVKPSEVTPLSTLYVAKLAREIGFPPGVINLVVGLGPDAGAALTNHPKVRRMSFTGSPEVGSAIGEACGRRLVPCKLELGGKGAAVVFDDVDPAATARKLADAITMNTGQVCCTATRWIVHEHIFDQLVADASAALRQTRIGPALDRNTDMGPVVSQVQLDRVLGYMKRARKQGASVLLEGGRATGAGLSGFFVKPELLQGGPDNVCFREEIFGPVAYLTPFKDEQEAVELVNRLDYGLANSVWSNDLGRAQRVAERMVAGNSWINAHKGVGK